MPTQGSWREGEFGNRAVRIANCSGYHGDNAGEMYKQATGGDIDFITGDYLAEMNMANNAEAFVAGKHAGYEETAWVGLQQSIDVIHQKQIKVAVNGGALNPQGLAIKVSELAKSKGYNLKVSYVSGDNLLPKIGKVMPQTIEDALPHLDSTNKNVNLTSESFAFTKCAPDERRDVVSANAYLGARAIYHGFRNGADIIICGRVADASPVIAAAWYWWSWSETDYDQLAGALVSGHLIECSAYITGGNFSGFDKFDDLDQFIEPGFPIAEVDSDGTCVITKHPGTQGMVTTDTCICQFLYELQGNAYLNSDVTAYLDDIRVEKVGDDRVRVSGIKGVPPPSTTKLAIFYKGGFESQYLLNATGYGYDKKFELLRKQIRYHMENDLLEKLEVFEFQLLGTPAYNPSDQTSSTVYFRIFAQAADVSSLAAVGKALGKISLRHYSGLHSSLDMRTAMPRPYLAYFPALWPQNKIEESINLIDTDGKVTKLPVDLPSKFEDLGPRASYDTKEPCLLDGPTKSIRLGDIALARSGDKGGNLNFGLFVHTERQWKWLRTYFSRERIAELIKNDLRAEYSIERVEFANIYAVHFVVYGILGRGVTSSARLDGLGKGFADYIRDKVVDVPEYVV